MLLGVMLCPEHKIQDRLGGPICLLSRSHASHAKHPKAAQMHLLRFVSAPHEFVPLALQHPVLRCEGDDGFLLLRMHLGH